MKCECDASLEAGIKCVCRNKNEEITVFRCNKCNGYELAAMDECTCEKFTDYAIPARQFVPKDESRLKEGD